MRNNEEKRREKGVTEGRAHGVIILSPIAAFFSIGCCGIAAMWLSGAIYERDNLSLVLSFVRYRDNELQECTRENIDHSFICLSLHPLF